MSFSLIPIQRPNTLTIDIAVVNREGDIEIRSFHDTAQIPLWSARGDLAIGAGLSYRILPGVTDTAPPPEPWDISQLHDLNDDAPTETSRDRGAETHHRRTASSKPESRTSFGRDEKDGFPPLIPSRSESVHTRSISAKEKSPSSLRRIAIDLQKKAESSGKEIQSIHVDQEIEVSRRSETVHLRRPKAHKLHTDQIAGSIVADDISMYIRWRAIQGYGPTNVSFLSFYLLFSI